MLRARARHRLDPPAATRLRDHRGRSVWIAMMLKSDLIERIAAENPHLHRQDVETLVNTILDSITAALARGDRVELRDFGVYATVQRSRYLRRQFRRSRPAEACTAGSIQPRADRCPAAPPRWSAEPA